MSEGGRHARYKSFARNPYGRMVGWLQDGLFKKLFTNSAWLLGAQGIAAVIGVGGMVIKTRTLGPELFGLLTVVLAYVGIVGSFSSFQSWQALIKFGADAIHHKDPVRFMGYVKLGFMVDAVGALLGGTLAISGAFLLAGWQDWSAETQFMMAAGGSSLFLGFSGTPTGVLRILDRFKWFTVQQTCTALLGFAGAVLVYFMGWGVKGFFFSTLAVAAFGNMLLLAMGLIALHKDGYLKHIDAPLPAKKPFARFAGWTYLSSTLDIPFKQFDVLIASAVISLEAAGVYRVLKQVTQIFAMIVDPVYQALYPQAARLINEGDKRSAMKYAMKIGIIMFSVLGPSALLAGATAYWWLGVIFGEEFRFAWLSLGVFIALKAITTPTIVIHPLFTAMGFVKYNAWILFVVNAIYIGTAWMLGSRFGMNGLIAAWFIHVCLIVSAKTAFMRYSAVVKWS